MTLRPRIARFQPALLVAVALAAGCRGIADPVEPSPAPDPTGRYALVAWPGPLPTPGLISIVADTLTVTRSASAPDSGRLVERLWISLPPSGEVVADEVGGSYSQSLRLALRYDCDGPQASVFCLLIPRTIEAAELVGDELRVFAPGGVLRRYRRLSK